MATSNESAEILASIYDAVLDPSRWDEVVGRIVRATNSVSGTLAVHQADSIHLSSTYNIDPVYLDDYAKNWHKKNPLDIFKDSVSPGELTAYTPITQSDTFKASPYFNEFIDPQGWSDGAIACLGRGHASAGFFGIIRSPKKIWVEPADWHLLETLVPHLQRAAEVQQLLSRSMVVTASLSQAFTAAGFGIFLVAADCRILFSNERAEILLRRRIGLRYCVGRLMATDRVANERLQALVLGGSKLARGNSECGGTLELRRDTEDRPLIAHVIPLAPHRTLAVLDLERPAAAVFVVDPSADLLARVRLFAAGFGLTAAEIRVLAELIGGSQTHVVADKLKIAEGTVRTHTKHILAKTGTTRQTELFRRFFETSLPGCPSAW
jgi:DNA-binding CsgD family transcriptional regulator